MSDTSDRLRHAQRVLDRCNGDLAKAMTYAAFRLPVRRVLDETWPVGVFGRTALMNAGRRLRERVAELEGAIRRHRDAVIDVPAGQKQFMADRELHVLLDGEARDDGMTDDEAADAFMAALAEMDGEPSDDTDRLAEVRDWLDTRDGIESTHYDGCWKHHPACMGAVLLAEVERLETELASFEERPPTAVARANQRLIERVAVLEDGIRGLLTLGNERWKTPGHPMNGWVRKDRVHDLARALLDDSGGKP